MIEQWLSDWADWKQGAPLSHFPPESPNYRIMMNLPPSGGISDGGMVARVSKLGKLLEIDGRAQELDRLMRELPAPYQEAIVAKFVVPAREKTRSERAAAVICGLSQGSFRARYMAAIAWLAGRLDLPLVAA